MQVRTGCICKWEESMEIGLLTYTIQFTFNTCFSIGENILVIKSWLGKHTIPCIYFYFPSESVYMSKLAI